MRIEEAESALQRTGLPAAPRSLRERVLEDARRALETPPPVAPVLPGLPQRRPEGMPWMGALVAAVAVFCVILAYATVPPRNPPERLDELVACIRDPGAPGRARAVSALSQQAGRKAMPLAASLLEDRDPDVRAAAATMLVVGGATDIGVSALLREGRGFTVLNLLRSPNLWKALTGARGPSFVGQSAPDRIRELGLAAELEVLIPATSLPEERRWATELRRDPPGPTILASLETALRRADGSPGPYEMILEAGSLRLLPRAQAEQFWRAWWEGPNSKD